MENSSYTWKGGVEGILEPRNTIQHLVWAVYFLCSHTRYGEHLSIKKFGVQRVFIEIWVKNGGKIQQRGRAGGGILELRNTIQHLVWPVYVLYSQHRYGQHKSIEKIAVRQELVKI